MNILYIWDSDYPWDVRVEKICRTLLEHGHSVHIAARNLKKSNVYENQQGLQIHRLRPWGNDRINYVLSFPAFFSPVWKHFVDDIIRRHAIEMIIVRDLPLAIAGIWAGKRHNIPVVFDMAEDYVAMIWDIWRSRKFQGLNFLARNPYLARLVENYVFKKSDHILVVVDEAKDLVVTRGVLPEKATVVGNTPLLDALIRANVVSDEIIDQIRSRYSVIYTGGIQMGRGIQVVFDSMPEIIKEIEDFLFVIVGDGYATPILKEMMREKKVQDHVLWVGWIDHQLIFNYIRACNAGIIPHFTSDHVNTTIPNKIFDYMGLGLPVISSDATPMKRILEQEQCGITFQSGNAVDLARAVIEIYHSELKYGENGKNAVTNRYNWANDKMRLINVVGNLMLT